MEKNSAIESENNKNEKKKIDKGWKEEAKKEKERLKKETEKENFKFPKATFTTFITGLATQILLSLGEMENPVTEKKEKDLKQAKFTIDTLQVLKEKTEGNLTDEEKKYLENLLYDMRMKYIQAARV